MFRVPTWRMSAYSATMSTCAGLHDLGDHRQPGPLAGLRQVAQPLDAQALERVRAGPGLEGAAADDRGAAAPRPRRPSPVSWSRLSTEHGPAMTVRLPSPIVASRTRMTVSSGWNSREVSLNGRLIGGDRLDPGQGLESGR